MDHYMFCWNKEVKMLTPKAKLDAVDATIRELIYIGFEWLPLYFLYFWLWS